MSIIIGTPHSKGGGYFCNDKETSRRQEADVRTCSHCQAIIKMQEWKENGAWCGKCQSPLCSNHDCAEETARIGCVPFVKKFDHFVEQQHRLQVFLKAEGEETPVPPSIIIPG